MRLLVAAVVLAGCSSSASGPMTLSWKLADNRDCFTAGATVVELRDHRALSGDTVGAFRCSDGLAPAMVTVDNVPGSGTLYADALTPLGADLYHGELSLTASPPGTAELRTVTLYAVAASSRAPAP